MKQGGLRKFPLPISFEKHETHFSNLERLAQDVREANTAQ